MDRLPPEIISNIVRHAGDHSLTPLSLLCRRWQPIVEARIYRELHISYLRPRREGLYKSIKAPSHKTLTNNLTPTRLSYIRQLHVEIARNERKFPVRSINIIRQLFDLLTRVPHNQEPLLNLHFNLRGFFSDFFDPDSSNNVESPLYELPELPMARSFRLINEDLGTGLSPRTLMYMASKMPRLRELDVTTLDVKSTHQRVELARSLAELPTSIRSFSLQYRQKDDPEGLLVTDDGEDILTRELRRFSQREVLKEFTFGGCAQLSIFWPPDSATSEPRHWPTLEAFQIQFHHPQYLASLYATESLDHAQDANNSDKTDVHKEIMSDSFRALAKCSACMPKAEENYVYFGNTWRTRFAYCTMFPEDPCVTVTGKLDFELDEETLDEWRKTAEAHNLDFQMCIEEWTE